ncbi:thialysine N-epsilon-acetyltransferase-like [Argopecten irradians]|uniref:thialysine N-epsilon-acetyltransferase-like n=1 Tax=Argopecten irradians TaxID=31199 RepID=UPI00371906C5
MMSGFNIREAREEDIDDIYRMLYELAKDLNETEAVHVTPAILRENQKLYKCFVTEDNVTDDYGTRPLIGFAQYVYRFDGWEGLVAILDNIWVDPRHRNRGIGSALYKAVAREAVASGCIFLEQLVHDWNTSAKEFYKAKGAYDYTEKMKGHVFRTPRSKLEELSNRKQNS